MVHHLFATFLDNPSEYQKAIAYWCDLWARVDPIERAQQEWIQPWLTTGASTILDGNPIFSAYSRKLRKGIRVVQYQPESPNVEFDYWLDTYGGEITDPQSINELVITCALSKESAMLARSLIESWIAGPASLRYSYAPMAMNSVIESHLVLQQPDPLPRAA
jgi:hypothetical protein